MRQSTRHLAIVAVTPEEAPEALVVRALRAGADECVSLKRPGELAARIAVQLRNNRYRQMLRQLRSERDVLKVAATMDPLTRIPNRRALVRAMKERVQRGTPFGLLFLDIDRFKKINDEHGHDVGDQVLKRIAKYLERGIRSNDYCGRYGGEELLVLVHGADEPLAAKVAERHRRAISALRFAALGPDRRITVSVGVAAFDPDVSKDLDTVVKLADRALYQAKNSGRDQVVPSSDLPRESATMAEGHGLAGPDDDEHEDIEAALVRTLEAKRGSLPVLPEVATQALRIANDPDANLQRFAALVDRDPHIAARFISIANSVIYSRGIKTTTTNAAVVRVGLHGARDILFQVVYSASAMGLPRYQQAVGASFRRSVLAAVAARCAARLLGIRSLYAYLAGLLHDIGEARVYRVLATLPKPPNEDEAAKLVMQHHCRAGTELAEAWNLPDEIIYACSHHHDEDNDSTSVRLVRIADTAVDSFLSEESAAHGTADADWYQALGLQAHHAETLFEEIAKAHESLPSSVSAPRSSLRRRGT